MQQHLHLIFDKMPPFLETPEEESSSSSSSSCQNKPSSRRADDGIICFDVDEETSSTIAMELYFESVEQAVENWKVVQQIENYELVVGSLLFKG